jgi:peptidoglycan/LPS O-acetylase OafA/YrhL
MIPRIGDNYVQPRTLIGNIEFFVFGLICANIKPIQFFYGRLIKALIVFSAIAFAWWLNNYDLGRFWGPGAYNFPLGGGQLAALVVSAAILLISAESRWKKADMFFSPFQWCGFYCYGIYVWHSVMGSVSSFWKINGDLDRFIILMLAIPLAQLSYKFIEKPMLSFKVGGAFKSG